MNWLTDDQLMRPVSLVVQDGVGRNAQQVVQRGGKVGLRAWGLGGVGCGVVGGSEDGAGLNARSG